MTFAWWHVLVAIVPTLPGLWSIWHIWDHEFADMRQKACWLVFVVFVPVIGGLVYIFVGRHKAGHKVQRG